MPPNRGFVEHVLPVQDVLMELPSGRVTFAFTDVVGSTRAFAEHGDAFVSALRATQSLVAETTRQYGGSPVSTEGDGAFLAFPSAEAAVAALCEIQSRLAEPGSGLMLQLRAGAHTGDAVPVGDDYVDYAVHVAARVSSAAGPGQVLLSQAVVDDLPAPVGVAVGVYELKDVAEPTPLWRAHGQALPPRAVPIRRTNVAEPRTTFLGRAGVLQELGSLMARPSLVTLVGPGGLGKTRLASQLCLDLRQELSAGCWLVELASVDSATGIANAAGRVLGLVGADASAVAIELSRRGPLLLVLDNCEHLIEDVATFAERLVHACPELRLLCTSREALAVDGERVLGLSALDTARDGEPGEAERLFLDRAASAGAKLGPADLAGVTRVSRLLDGLPLALELAAAQASSMSLKELEEALEGESTDLARRGGAARQRSLDEVVAWSLQLLDPDELDQLLALSTFTGRFTDEAAHILLRNLDVQPLPLSAFVRRSLLDRDGDSYRMLFTIHGAAQRQLRARPELHEAAMHALVTWAVERTDARLAQELRRQPPPDDEICSLETALLWGWRQGRHRLGQLFSLIGYFASTGARRPGLVALAEAVLAGPLPQNAQEVAHHLSAISVVGDQQGYVGVDEHRLADLVAVAERVGGPDTRLGAWFVQAMAHDHRGEFDLSRTLRQRILSDPDCSTHNRRLALMDLGVSRHLAGDLEAAAQLYHRARELAQQEQDAHALVQLDTNLGELLLDQGRHTEALEQLKGALRAAAGQARLRPYLTALIAEAQLGADASPDAQAFADAAERDLALLATQDPFFTAVRDRLRAARQA